MHWDQLIVDSLRGSKLVWRVKRPFPCRSRIEHTRNSLTVAGCNVSGVMRATSLAFVPLSRKECARTIAPGRACQKSRDEFKEPIALLTRQVVVAQQELSIPSSTKFALRGKKRGPNTPCNKPPSARTPSRLELLNTLQTKRKGGITPEEKQ